MTLKEFLTVQQIDQLEDKAPISGFKGVLRELEPRKGKTSRKHFYIGFMTDQTGRMRVTFFRHNMDGLQGRLLRITANHQGKGIRKDIYNKTTEMTVFKDAQIDILNPDALDVEKKIQKEVSQQAAKYLESPGQTIVMSGNASARIVAAVLLTPSVPDPIQWLYSENFPQLVDRLMSVYVKAVRRQETIHNRQ